MVLWNFLNLFGQYWKAEVLELLGANTVPLVLGYLIFLMGTKIEREGRYVFIKWFGAIPLFLGIIYNYRYIVLILDPIYFQGFYVSDKAKFLHYSAFVLPILGLFGLFIWGKIIKKSTEYE